MNLTEDQIFSLAPDEASKKSGKDLANLSKWVTKGINDKALWGECQGSGSKPYQTQIDINNIAFKCSCPSRKFPCKHGLGLLLLYARNKNSFSDNNSPQWVTEWISKRAEKSRRRNQNRKRNLLMKLHKQNESRKARQQKVTDGIEELRLWIKDIVCATEFCQCPIKGFLCGLKIWRSE